MEAILVRVGLALAAGVLIGLVPLAHRLTRYEPSVVKRVVFHIVSVLALLGFCALAWFLWENYIPRAPEAPPPVVYPVSPASPAAP